MDKTRTVGQKRLINREELSFWPLKKWTKAQSNRSFETTFFLSQGVSKRVDFMKSVKVIFHIKPRPFLMRM